MTHLKKVLILLLLSCSVLSSCSTQHEQHYQGWVENRLVYLAVSTSGILKNLNVSRGQHVESGQQLYQLDRAPEIYALGKARYHLIAEQQTLENLKLGSRKTILSSLKAKQAQAQAISIFQKASLRRSKKLFSSHAISLAELQKAQSSYKTAKQKDAEIQANIDEAKLGARKYLIAAQKNVVKTATETVKMAQWKLKQKTVRAEQDSIVFDTLFRQGEFVPAGQPVLSLMNPANTLIIFFIPEPKLSSIHIGQSVYVKADGNSKRLTAIIRYIYPRVEYTPPVIYSRDMQQKLSFRVEATVTKKVALQLNPGQPVSVYFQPKG